MDLKRSFALSCVAHICVGITLLFAIGEFSVSFDVTRGLSGIRVAIGKRAPVHRERRLSDDLREVRVVFDAVWPASSIIPVHGKESARTQQEDDQTGGTAGALSSRALENSRNHPPGYPYMARRLGHQGIVTLAIEVLPDGRAGRVVVSASSGYAMLDNAACDAAKKWIFFAPGEMALGHSVVIYQKIAFVIE